MDRLYFKIVDAALETAQLANSLARNANYWDQVDQRTRPFLKQYFETIEYARRVMFSAVRRQMNNDPNEPDILKNRQQP